MTDVDTDHDAEKAARRRRAARMVALADIYVNTNRAADLAADRADAVARARENGATDDEILKALGIRDDNDNPGGGEPHGT